MQHVRRILVCAGLAVLLIVASSQTASSFPSRFNTYCVSCHSNDAPTCDGCHHHKATLGASADHASYNPGAPVVVTLTGGTEGGWIRAILYDASHQELTRATGPTGQGDDNAGNPVQFPVQLHATAPVTPGDYVWQAAWFGNNNGSGHIESGVNVTIHVVQNPADVSDDAPVIRRTWGRIKSQHR
jgi:hypothetical protein